MITVKSQRSEAAKPANSDIHVLKEDLSPYRLPAIVALMLGSLMLYLRSFLPVRADVAEADKGPNPFLDSAEKDRVGPVDAPASVTEGAQVADQSPRPSPYDADSDSSPATLRGRGNASQQDANVLKGYELSAFRDLVRPANTNFPDMPRDSLPRFSSFPTGPGGGGNGVLGGSTGGNPDPGGDGGSSAGGTAGGGGTGGSGTGNTGTGNTGTGPDNSDDDDDDDIVVPPRNRAPRNSGPVYLADVATGAVLIIALSDLLINSSDPDGDALTVANLRATSGTIVAQPDGTWLFTPSPTNLGRSVISFDVMDGTTAVPQMAFTMVTSGPVDTGGGDDTGPGGGDPGDDICAEPGAGVTGYNPVIGGVADDVLIGTDGNDLIRAGAGHDTAFGGQGDDLVYGGDGRDHLSGGAGNDQMFGDADDDILSGDDGDDLLDGGAGNDVVLAGVGDDAVYGGEGDDVLAGGDGADQMSGGQGADLIQGDAGHDIMFGDSGADVLLGDTGRDVMDGGADNDSLFGGADADVLIGGAGDDQLAGGEGADLLQGGDGDDQLAGDAGNDTVLGGVGADEIDAGAGDDWVSDGAGEDLVLLAAGDDWMAVSIDLNHDHFDGGAGTDTLDLSSETAPVVVDLVDAMVTANGSEADTFTGFEAFVGGSGDDTFIAGTSSAVLTGGDGDDRFRFDHAPAIALPASGAAIETLFQITDFDVGDRISISRYDFFEDLADSIEDHLDDYFSENGNSGRGNDDPRVRIRHEHEDDHENTWIEIDFDRDEFYETSITLQGHRLFVVVENDVTPV